MDAGPVSTAQPRLRILLYSPYYAPELISIGKYNTEAAQWLAARGHAVRVVTAAPHYPGWRTWSGWSAWRYTRELRDGVEVLRCPAWIPARPGGLARTLYALSHAAAALPVLLAAGRWRPDVILAVEPPLLTYLPAWLAARVAGARAWLHVQDLEVDAAFELGIVRGRFARQLASRFESTLLRSADLVSTISGTMADRLAGKGLPPGAVAVFPNWVGELPADPPGLDYRRDLGIPADARVALYAGNMAGKQGLETIVQAARLLRGRQDVWFVLVGDGPSRASLQAAAEGLPQVRFLPLQPAEHLGALLRLAHVHMLPQRAAAADLVMPSKLGGMFASARATVAGARADTELSAVVAGRGLVVPPEDPEAFAGAITRLCDDPALAARFGAAAHDYAVREMGRDAILGRLEAALQRLVAGRVA